MEPKLSNIPSSPQHRGKSPLLPALTGVRFFAVFHIFLFHLWVLYDMEKPDKFKTLLGDFSYLPDPFIRFISNGFISTSFFFMLSGFILSYLYWGRDGNLSMPSKRFWFLRLSRLYPIHLIVMLITIPLVFDYVVSGQASVVTLVLSGIATLTLMQSWVPAWIPVWDWPTWALSTLVFLYLCMPWLMKKLAVLSKKQMLWVLFSLPVISLVPTIIFAIITPGGEKLSEAQSIFLKSTPLFWVPHFIAGMLLSRVFEISRFSLNGEKSSSTVEQASQLSKITQVVSCGDIALVVVVAIACLIKMDEPVNYFFRHGLLMPLYMVIIIDLARAKGIAAKLFSLPGTGFLGDTAFSIFIWQNLVMIFCWIAVSISPSYGNNLLLMASVGMIGLATVSTYGIEKPLAKWLRRKFFVIYY